MRIIKLNVLFLVVSLFLSVWACKKDNEDVPQPKDKEAALDGLWRTEGYGYLYEIKDGKATRYDITNISCVKAEEDIDVTDWNVQFNASRNTFTKSLRSDGAVTSLTFKKLNELPEVYKNGGTAPTKDATVNFDILWQTFQEHYPFFELRNVDWAKIREEYRSRVTEQNLYEIFVEMLAAFEDGHVGFQDENEEQFFSGTHFLEKKFKEEGGYSTLEEYYVQELGKFNNIINESYLKGALKTAANGKLLWGRLNENIGYLKVESMTSYSDNPDMEVHLKVLEVGLDEVMNDLKDTKGLVIDIRFNGGGSDLASLAIAGRFTSKSMLAWTKKAPTENGFTTPQPVYLKPTGKFQYTKPVVLLTSNATASAAETFALSMKLLPHVTLLGEHTNGIFSDMLVKHLPNGWMFALSNEVHQAPDGSIPEKVGIQPSIELPIFPKEDRVNGKDSAIDKALQLLK